MALFMHPGLKLFIVFFYTDVRSSSSREANWTIVHNCIYRPVTLKPYEAYFICQILHWDQCSSGVLVLEGQG